MVMSGSSKSRAKPRRIIALWFPRLSTDRLQRRENISATAPPLVIVSKVRNAIALQAVDRKATQLGLRFGQPLANARAMLPDLCVVTADETADAQLLRHIADWCDRFTPLVALDGDRRLLLDVTGVCHFFGGEQNMLAQICSKLEAQGLAVRGAMAGTAAAARALARYKKGSVISPGKEAEAVKPLPVEALGLDHTIIHAFRRAGLKTIGQVASRKRDEINARFGAGTLALLDEILGQGAKPISPRLPRAEYWKEKAFPEPIATDDMIQDTLKSLAMGVSALMQKNGVGARQLQVSFFRADGAVRTISIALGMATREPIVILRLFREKLDVLHDPLDPGFGFDLIRLSATEVARFDVEVAELDTNLAAQKEIGFLVDRLATRFGANRILTFQPNDTHVPENAFSTVSAQKATSSKAIWEKLRATDSIPRRPLRLFKQVLPASLTDSQLNWRRASRQVIEQEGPERIAMEWWRHEDPQPDRDYFRMEDDQGRRYWLYRYTATEQYFLHGLFA
jgi:protein ImuB